MEEKSDKISSLLEWERKKWVTLAQIGLIVLIIGLFIYRVIYVFDLSYLSYEIVTTVALFIFYSGLLLLSLSMFTISINDKDLHIYLRVVLILAVAWMITNTYSGRSLFFN